MTSRRRWSALTIEQELHTVADQLGRMPRRDELATRGLGGLWSAMSRHGGVAHWRANVAAHLAPSTDDIRLHAYLRAERAGGGDPVEHWLAAERALRA